MCVSWKKSNLAWEDSEKFCSAQTVVTEGQRRGREEQEGDCGQEQCGDAETDRTEDGSADADGDHGPGRKNEAQENTVGSADFGAAILGCTKETDGTDRAEEAGAPEGGKSGGSENGDTEDEVAEGGEERNDSEDDAHVTCPLGWTLDLQAEPSGAMGSP